MAMQEMITIRPAELEVAPTFQGSVHECPVNVYRMKIQAQSADARRFSFAWRSPGNNLICSPQGFVEFDLACHIPYNFTESEALSAICGHVDRSSKVSTLEEKTSEDGIRSFGYNYLGHAARANLAANVEDRKQQIPGSRGYRAGLAFGEGDAVGSCIESIQYTINGASISHQNWHLFKRSLDRCWIPSRVMQRVYSGAGGAWNAYDCTPLSGQVSRGEIFGFSGNNAGADDSGATKSCYSAKTVEGFTADTGLARRMKNLYASITGETLQQYPSTKVKRTAQNNGSSFKLRVRFPLCGGLFNPCWGESGLSRSCPYQRLALAIPNYNQGSLTILFKNLERCVVRRLGRTLSINRNSVHGTLINNSEATKVAKAREANAGGVQADAADSDVVPFTIAFATDTLPHLFLTYMRLQSFRRPPEVASFTTYRTQTYLGDVLSKNVPETVLADASAFNDGIGSLPYLKCDGRGLVSKQTVASAGYQYDLADEKRRWDVSFQNLQFAQPPSYIFICAQKNSDTFNHKNPLLSQTGYDLVLKPGDDVLTQFQGNGADRAAYLYQDAITPVLLTQTPAGTITPSTVNTNLNNRSAAKINQLKTAGRYIAQNQDSNLAIDRLKILVQSSVGSFQVTDDVYPFLRDQQIIWDEHRRNCNTDYFVKSGISDWQKRGCCVLLSVSQYLHGLGSSAGVAFPIQISCEVDFVNKCKFIEGLYAYDEKGPRGPMTFADYINARPVLVGIFDKQVLQIASSSAVLSAQNISQASFSQIVASRQ